MTGDRPTLSVIIVSWNVRQLLRRALTSCRASWGERPGLEIVVVDNGSTDGTVTMVRETFPWVVLVANEENRGFTGGNNDGLERAQGVYLLLLNPDTEVLADALPRLVHYMDRHPSVGMLGPQLLNPDGSVQSSRRRFPTLPVLFCESTWLQGLLPRRLLAHYYVEDRSPQTAHPVEWITGAAMLTRRAVVDEVGGLDETFFMYSEELDWCRRIRAAGWEIHYTPEARIIHHEGKSSEQVVPARHIYFQSSKIHYTRKYHGPRLAEILRLWLLGQYVWQIGVEGSKWLVGHRRSLRAERLHAYRRVLRSGLRQRGPLPTEAGRPQPGGKDDSPEKRWQKPDL
ncbi:MAG: glycosyltransferase family 2 protein [Anaerolineae bacterium]